MAEENPYLAQIAKNSGLTKEAVDSDNPYIKQAQINAGKPLEYKTAPDKFMSGLEQASSTINVTNRYSDSLANYAKYDVGLNPFGEDWNEIRANNQGVGEKIGRGLLKMGTTMGGAIAENTIGVVSGLASLATGGTYADNAVGRSVDEMNEWMAENLPHYYTQKEMDPDRSVLASLGTANFWTDKFANGLGYSLGSLATVWLTGGEGLIAKGIGAAGKGIATMGEAASVAKVATTGEKLKKIYEASKMIKTGTKLADDVSRTAKIARGLNAVKHLEVGAMMSLAESSVEAREKSKQFIQEKFDEWEEDNPGKSVQQDMTSEEREAILSSARAVENSTFALNMGILMPTNLFTFGSMIGGSKKLAGFKIGEDLTEDIVKKEGKYILKTPNTAFGKTLQKVNKFTSPIYKNALNESFQEGAQYAIGVGAGEYFKNKFDTGSGDFIQAFSKGMSETFGSADGMESMLLGALIGGGMGATSTTFGAEASKRKNMAANTEQLLAIKNSPTFMNLAADAEMNQEILRTGAAIAAANDVGNYKLANELRKQLIAQRANKLQRLDAEDLGLEEFDDLEKMSEEEFMKRTGYDTTKTQDGTLKSTFSEQSGGKSHVQVIQDLREEYKKASKLSKDLDDIVLQVNPNKSGLPGLLQGKERKQADATHRLYNQRLKNILMGHMVSIDTRDEEINKSIDELRRFSPEGPDSFANINKDDLLALVKKNKITVSPTGEIQFPRSVVSTTLSDTASEEAKAKAKAEEQSPEGQRKKKEDDDDNKMISRMEKAIRYADTLNPIDKMKFNNELQNLFTGLQMREESIAAFEELVTSPEKRDIEMLARQSAQAEAKITNDNKEASVTIDEARSTLDLEHFINNDSLSPELREKLLKKYQELKEVEDKYAENFNILTDAHLKDLIAGIDEIKDADPQKAAALLRVIADRAGETTADKEARVNSTPTEEQKKAKADAEASINNMKGSDANTPNGKTYVNNIRVTTSDNRNLIVNGIPYKNNKVNIMDAIQADMTQLTPDGKVPVVSITLTNEAGQVVKFKAEDNPQLVDELAEVMMIGYVAEATADTINLSLEESESRAADILNVLKKGKEILDNRIDLEGIEPTPQIYMIAAKELQKFLDGLSQVSTILEQAYKRSNIKFTALYKLQNYIDARELHEEYAKKLEEIQRMYRELEKIPTEGDPNAKPGEVDKQGGVDFDSEIGKLKANFDTLESTIKNYEKAIEGLQAEAETNPTAATLIEKYIENIRLAKTEQGLIQDQITKLQQLDEARKSDSIDQDVQNAQEPTGSNEEQGGQGQSEGATEVSSAEELDLNMEGEPGDEEAILNSLAGSDFMNEDTGTDDTTIQVDYQAAEEEEEEEYEDEDSFTPETPKETVEEEKANTAEYAGEIDARLVKNEYRTTDNFDNVIVSSDGTPLINEDYYGNGIPKGQPGSKLGIKQLDSNGDEIKIYPKLLSSSLLSPNNTEILFDVRTDTKFWNENKDGIPAGDHWRTVPIFVAIKQANGKYKRVGLLESFNPDKAESNQSRKDIYENFLKGKRVTSTIAGKRYNTENIANAVGKDGEAFFYNPFKDGAIPTLMISSIEKESGLPKFQLALVGDNITEKDVIPTITSYDSELGKVAMLVKTPIGGFKHLFLTTKRITKGGLEAAKLAILQGRSGMLNELIGFNKVAKAAVNLEKTDMLFSDALERTDVNGDTTITNVYTFYHPQAESYIRISSAELAKALSNQTFEFSFVKAEIGEKGGVDFNPDPDKKGLYKIKEVYNGVVDAFEKAVLQRRHQVSSANLQSNQAFESPYIDPETGKGKMYNSYTEYLADPNAIPDIDSDGKSHTGILGSDMFLNEDGSPYFDVGITYGPLLVEGKPLYDNNSAASPQSAKAKLDPKEFEESDEHSNDNDDQEQTDENLFDTMMGDTIEETPQDETTGSTTSFEDLAKSRGAKTQEKKEEDEFEEPKVAEMDEEDRGLNDPLVNRLIDIKENEFKGMFEDPATKEETHYKIQPKGETEPKKFQRITSISSEPFNGTKEVKQASSRAGNTVHDIVESVLMGKTDYTRGDKMSRVAFLELINQIGDIRRLIKSKGETVIATEMIVYTDSYGDYAGKFDILVKRKDKQGVGPQYYIYDIKTGSEGGLANYEKGYTDPQTKKVSKSKRDQHGTQLSMYAYSLVGVGKLKPANIAGASVLYLPIRYNTEGYIEKVSGMAEKKFTLSYNIKELLKGEVSFELKKTVSSSDPSIANAGSKKASTKATTKSEAPKGKEVDKEEKGVKKQGKVTKESLASDLLNAGESKGGPAAGVDKQLADLKKSITKSGGMDDTMFIQIVKDTFGITLTEEESDKLQNNVLEGIC
jgi:hypothetical protein